MSQRCARCREVVDEIRELGDAVRAVAVAPAPGDLWRRIEAAAPGGGCSRPSRSRRATGADRPLRRRGLLVPISIAAIAAVAVAVIAWPRAAGLHAAVTSRLTFAPARPVPGGVLTVRYEAPEWMRDAKDLVLVGRFARPAGHNASPFAARMEDALADSLGVLSRTADGSFAGTLRLPPGFLAVQLSVYDAVRDQEAMDGVEPWLVIGGSPTRGPRWPRCWPPPRSAPTGLSAMTAVRARIVDVADSLRRYFPRHPAGWAYSRSYGVSRGRFDLLRFFESAERKYASLTDELWPQRGLDAERLHDMVIFAHRIDEPGEVLRWAGRLAEEHPEDPRALGDLAGALHEMELRMPPSLADSIRAWLPALDLAYRRAPVPNHGFDEAFRLAASYGDTLTKARWHERGAANGRMGNVWMLTSGRRRPAGDSVAVELRTRAERSCTLPAGRLPLGEIGDGVADALRDVSRHGVRVLFRGTRSGRHGPGSRWPRQIRRSPPCAAASSARRRAATSSMRSPRWRSGTR